MKNLKEPNFSVDSLPDRKNRKNQRTAEKSQQQNDPPTKRQPPPPHCDAAQKLRGGDAHDAPLRHRQHGERWAA